MNVLIISRTSWNKSGSFGNTFNNLFGGIGDMDIYHICCQSGSEDFGTVKKCYCMTDKLVVKSIIRSNRKTGYVLQQNDAEPENIDFYSESIKKIKARRNIFALFVRDLIWKLGKWKKSDELKAFIAEAKPDVIYLPIYSSCYMCDIQEYIINNSNVKVVGHISDDVYNYPGGFYSPLKWLYIIVLRKKLRKLISHCEYLEVFAGNMQKEYREIFCKPTYLIGKGVRPNSIPVPQAPDINKEDVTFVYTGNIGNQRYKVLCDIGHALDELSSEKKAKLLIYSGSIITDEINKEFSRCSSLHFMGSLRADKIYEVQKSADILVHVENFMPKSISETRMSLSTKIIDYLCIGKPILAVGPLAVNSIEFLDKNHSGIIISQRNDMLNILRDLLLDKIDLREIVANGYEYLKTERDISIIQDGIVQRLKSICEGEL